MPAKTTKWDAADFLASPEAIAAYLEAAFEDGDPRIISHAVEDVARAKGMGGLEKAVGKTAS